MICVGAAREGAGDREDGEEAEEGGGKEVEKDPGGDDVDERPLISAITIITSRIMDKHWRSLSMVLQQFVCSWYKNN